MVKFDTLSIVIPVYNEARTIHQILDLLRELKLVNGIGKEIILVNDCSTDASGDTIRGAVASWAKTLANELGPHGITVNNVLPGATLTQRHHALIEKKVAQTGQSAASIEADMLKTIPARRFGLAEEVAAAVAFLASPAAGYINGTSMPVDGGRTGAL